MTLFAGSAQAPASDKRAPGSSRRKPVTFSFYLVAAITVIVSFFPTAWIFLTSIKTEADIYAWPVQYLPDPVTLENYLNIFSETPELLGYILNSFIVATTTTFVILTCGGLAAYSLGRLTYRGRNFILILILAVSMFPPLALLPSLFNMFLELRMINSYSGLIIGHAGLYTPIAIWILTNFFKTVPHEIEDAARVDGASSLRIFWSIILPLSAPGLISTGLIVFIFSWNEFPLSLVSDERQFHAHCAGGHLALSGRIFVSLGDHHRGDHADDPALFW